MSAPAQTAPVADARAASLGTLFLTVFLDLLGFGLVIPFLPAVARRLTAPAFLGPPWAPESADPPRVL